MYAGEDIQITPESDGKRESMNSQKHSMSSTVVAFQLFFKIYTRILTDGPPM